MAWRPDLGWNAFPHTREERLRAGEATFDTLTEDLRWYERGLGGNKAVNQALNCFAVGNCVNNDDLWRDTGEGHAASPDSMLHWRGVQDGGLFGFAEILIVEEAIAVPKHRWRQSADKGSVEGYVYQLDPLTHATTPIEEAQVVVAGRVATTDSAGYYEFVGVPAGSSVVVMAYASIPYDPSDPSLGYATASNFVTVGVAPGERASAPDILLELPTDDIIEAWLHTVRITGSMRVEAEMTNKLKMQYEHCRFDVTVPILPPGLVEVGDPGEVRESTGNSNVYFAWTSDAQPIVKLRCTEANGTPDVRAHLDMKFTLVDGVELRTDVTHQLWEQQGDKDAEATWHHDNLPAGGSVNLPTMNLENPEWGDKDSCRLENFTVTFCQGGSC